MASTNKTAYLGLSQWLATDRPKREDFVADNRIIDENVKGHFTNAQLHLTADEKTKLSSPVEHKLVSGTGEASIIHTFSFTPSFVIVSKTSKPFSEYNAGGYTVVNGGFAVGNNGGSTAGIQLADNRLRLEQSTTAQNGVFKNLNEQYGQYLIVAFR
ncbi:MAG: hypothetical protein ACI4IS_03210 [Acutalibacteraceae bacterium]